MTAARPLWTERGANRLLLCGAVYEPRLSGLQPRRFKAKADGAPINFQLISESRVQSVCLLLLRLLPLRVLSE